MARLETAGLTLFAQGVFGYEPLRKGRRERLEDLRTGDGRPLPVHLKAQRELDRLEVLLEQLKTVEAERNALLDSRASGCEAAYSVFCGPKGVKGIEIRAIKYWA